MKNFTDKTREVVAKTINYEGTLFYRVTILFLRTVTPDLEKQGHKPVTITNSSKILKILTDKF